ncbi:hypothetical protein ACSLBF_13765 [Pseudoalteromonas sp. T1lg65]|uniref:hypothetical protein n=1 Tax=Pseudoalteromonas sp. T1lg65 TaxID=2077101 RepID=UPI003F79143B
MDAFQKFIKAERKLIKDHLYVLVSASLLGLVSVALMIIGLDESDNVYAEVKSAVQFGASGLVALGVLTIFYRLLKSYELGQPVFSHLSIQTYLLIAKVIMLYGLVAKPALSLLLEATFFDIKMTVTSFFANVDFVLAVAGYILHIFCAHCKVAKSMEDEQRLTI